LRYFTKILLSASFLAIFSNLAAQDKKPEYESNPEGAILTRTAISGYIVFGGHFTSHFQSRTQAGDMFDRRWNSDGGQSNLGLHLHFGKEIGREFFVEGIMDFSAHNIHIIRRYEVGVRKNMDFGNSTIYSRVGAGFSGLIDSRSINRDVELVFFGPSFENELSISTGFGIWINNMVDIGVTFSNSRFNQFKPAINLNLSVVGRIFKQQIDINKAIEEFDDFEIEEEDSYYD